MTYNVVLPSEKDKSVDVTSELLGKTSANQQKVIGG